MRYERPAIVRRESIVGLATVALSDVKPPPTNLSDVNKKDNIVPVAWAGESVAYEAPAIVGRDDIVGLATAASSDVKPPDGVPSDVNIKDNVVPVRW